MSGFVRDVEDLSEREKRQILAFHLTEKWEGKVDLANRERDAAIALAVRLMREANPGQHVTTTCRIVAGLTRIELVAVRHAVKAVEKERNA
jgi:hypothetical protein